MCDQATRERLENLKKQRRGLQEEEKRLLVTAEATSEAPSDTYENPVPGAENWSNEEIENAITDFQVLYDKVDRLQAMYAQKAEVNLGGETLLF